MDTNQQRMILLSTSISCVIVMLDTSIVNVALVKISQDLGTTTTGLQWIVNAYVIVFASLPLTGGALGDMFGARRMYIFGLAIFSVASLASGCAPTMPTLIAGRVMQAIGGSLLLPCSLSLLTHAYSDSTARAKAIASWSSWGSVALVVGPLAGGVLLAVFDWRSIFLVNVPLGLAGIWLTLKTDSHVVVRGNRRLDVPGQLSMAIAMILLTAALIEGAKFGWGNRWILTALVLSVLSGLSFIMIERRSTSPMLPLFLFSNSTFSLICYVFLSGAVAFFGMLFLLSLYFQRFSGYSPLQTGMALLPLSVSVMVGNIVSRRLVHRMDPLTLMFVGTGVRLFGFVGMAFTGGVSYPVMASQLILIGLGAGLGSPMSTSVFMSTVEKAYTGIASGILRTTGQLGSAIGVAIFGVFVADVHQIPGSIRIAASLAAALTVSIVSINWYLLRRSRVNGVLTAASAD